MKQIKATEKEIEIYCPHCEKWFKITLGDSFYESARAEERKKTAKEIFDYIERHYSLGYELERWKQLKEKFIGQKSKR